jgi:hypothetical protein
MDYVAEEDMCMYSNSHLIRARIYPNSSTRNLSSVKLSVTDCQNSAGIPKSVATVTSS